MLEAHARVCLRRQPLMKPHLKCRAHGSFKPALALLNHFILPCHQIPRQRFLSTAPETVANPAPQDGTGDEQPALDTSLPLPLTQDALQIALRAFHKSQDYEGVSLPPWRSHVARMEMVPWCVGLDKVPAGRERLSLEIAKFYQYAKPERREAIARKSLAETIQRRLRKLTFMGGYEVELFGSERTGLALALSDIDIRLSRHEDKGTSQPELPPDPLERENLRKTLRRIWRYHLRRNSAYIDPHIRNARYPLIHMIDKNTGLAVQIVSSNDTSKSIYLMQSYMKEFAHLRQVYFLVKTILDTRGLTEVYQGGVGSYTLFMMIVAALKHTKAKPTNVDDAYGTFMSFLDFWSEADLTQGVSIEPPVHFNKMEVPVMTEDVRAKIQSGERKPLPSWMLCLRDPADETNNLGRRAFGVKHVIATLRALREQLIREPSPQEQNGSFLMNMVGDVDILQFPRRQQLRRQGQALLHDDTGHFASVGREIRRSMRKKAQIEASTPLG